MTGAAQNKLGELFVDVGVGGLGKTLKGLNSISASFLLTKNAAVQAVKPFVNIGKEAMNSAVGIGKMAAALGTTSINAQKLSYYLKQYKSQGLEGDVASLQQTFTRLRAGYGGLDGQMAMSMGQLGIDWQNYSGSFEDTLRFVQDVKNALKKSGLSKQDQLMHLQNLGLGGWQYLFEKKDFNLEDTLKISDETIKNLQKSDETINELGNNVDQLKKNITSKALSHGGQTLLEDLVIATGNDEKAKKERLVGYKSVGTAWNQLKSELKELYNNAPTNEQLFKNRNKTFFNGNNLETINDSSLKNEAIISGALPSLTNAQNRPLEVKINTQIKSQDPQSTDFEILDIDVPEIPYVQETQRTQTGI